MSKMESDLANNNIKLSAPLPENFVGEKEWFFLYWIGFYKANLKRSITTADLAERIPVSQQTISRRSIELEEKGLIYRTMDNRSITIDLTEKGYLQLQKIMNNLNDMSKYFQYTENYRGVLQSGFGEGAYYIQKEKYLQQFKEKLGFEPYFGTLNVKTSPEMYELLIESQKFKNIPSIIIEGFKGKVREFGTVECYCINIWVKNHEEKKVPGALLQIHRTAHKKYILELIAPFYLRKHFNIKDGDFVFFQFSEKCNHHSA